MLTAIVPRDGWCAVVLRQAAAHPAVRSKWEP